MHSFYWVLSSVWKVVGVDSSLCVSTQAGVYSGGAHEDGSDRHGLNSSSSLDSAADTVAPLRPPSSNTTESVRRQRDKNKRDAVTAHCITSTISNISLETLLQSVEHMQSHLKIKHTTWSSWSRFKTDLTLKGFTEHALETQGNGKASWHPRVLDLRSVC